MLRNFEREVHWLVVKKRVGGAQCIQKGRPVATRKLNIHDSSENLYNVAGVICFLCVFFHSICLQEPMRRHQSVRASAPLTISFSSFVIAAWRARLRRIVISLRIRSRLFVELSMAIMRAACSLAEP